MSTPDKAAWRTLLRARRRQMLGRGPAMEHDGAATLPVDVMPPAVAGNDLARTGLALLGLLPAGGAVCAYVAMPGEPATGGLLQALTDSGREVFVPVCEPGFRLAWTPWHPDVPMARSALAPVMEPVGERFSFEQLGTVQAIFVPALAVDLAGVRLGQGGGYYDRFLPSATAVPVAAVVYGHEILPAGELPHNPLDAPVDYALTPGGYRALGHGVATIR